ncbi:MAG TPA: hypothetical protein VIE64_02340 [Solirubrobacterales bacterium]
MESLAAKSSLPRLGLAILAALVVMVPTAMAAEDPAVVEARKVYREQVEPICKKSTEDNSRVLKGVEAQVNNGALVPAGKRFIRASNIFGTAVAKLAKVPRPSADASTLKEWIGYLTEERSLLQKIGQALKAKKENKARTFATSLNRTNKKANNAVIEFEFHHCEIDSSKFL